MIRIGIIGVGNCASALIQGIEYYREETSDHRGLMHWDLGGYKPSDIEVVLAFDIDERKVGIDISEAIFKEPNNTKTFFSKIPKSNVVVSMGKVLDGVASHHTDYSSHISFRISKEKEPTKKDIINLIKKTNTQILVNFLPVGSEKATHFYVDCALESKTAFINNIPVFVASNRSLAEKFRTSCVPILGDDIKSQLGATIIHRSLVDLFNKRGVKIERSYQLNTGGNTDFLNMLDRSRLLSKKTSKTSAVQSIGKIENPQENLHVGPSDFVPWQKDNKICFLRIEGKLFGDTPVELDLKLSVEDSPNSAGVVIDAIRCCQLALDNNLCGAIIETSSYFFKHPPVQFNDHESFLLVEEFINKNKKK